MRLTLQLFPSAAIAQSPDHVVNDQAGRGHRQLPLEPDPYLLFSARQQIYPRHGRRKSTRGSPLPQLPE